MKAAMATAEPGGEADVPPRRAGRQLSFVRSEQARRCPARRRVRRRWPLAFAAVAEAAPASARNVGQSVRSDDRRAMSKTTAGVVRLLLPASRANVPTTKVWRSNPTADPPSASIGRTDATAPAAGSSRVLSPLTRIGGLPKRHRLNNGQHLDSIPGRSSDKLLGFGRTLRGGGRFGSETCLARDRH